MLFSLGWQFYRSTLYRRRIRSTIPSSPDQTFCNLASTQTCLQVRSLLDLQAIMIYTRVDWKVHRLTKILSWNVTKRGLFFNSHLCSLHTSSFVVAELGSHSPKKSSKADMTSYWAFQHSLVYTLSSLWILPLKFETSKIFE